MSSHASVPPNHTGTYIEVADLHQTEFSPSASTSGFSSASIASLSRSSNHGCSNAFFACKVTLAHQHERLPNGVHVGSSRRVLRASLPMRPIVSHATTASRCACIREQASRAVVAALTRTAPGQWTPRPVDNAPRCARQGCTGAAAAADQRQPHPAHSTCTHACPPPPTGDKRACTHCALTLRRDSMPAGRLRGTTPAGAHQSLSCVTPGHVSSLGVPMIWKMVSSCANSQSDGNRGGCTKCSSVSVARRATLPPCPGTGHLLACRSGAPAMPWLHGLHSVPRTVLPDKRQRPCLSYDGH